MADSALNSNLLRSIAIDRRRLALETRCPIGAMHRIAAACLGLKLQPEKTRVPIFVIDHIERPTPNDR